MRSNTGKDKGRDNLHDPTLRDRELGQERSAHSGENAKAAADHRKSTKSDQNQ